MRADIKKHMESGMCKGLGCKHACHGGMYAKGGEVDEIEPLDELEEESPERHRDHKEDKFLQRQSESELNELEPLGLAKGGEITPVDEGSDDELLDQCAGELIDALERKDKKEILESIKAIVMNCRG